MKSTLNSLLVTLAVTATPPALAETAVRNVVLVHGAFADEHSWDAVAGILTQRGYAVTQVANPLTSLFDDVTATVAALDAQNGPAVLVGHSWGGVVIGEAGMHSNVASLVYVTAFGPDRGESLNALLSSAPPSPGVTQIMPDASGGLILNPETFPDMMAGDLPPEQAMALAQQQIPSNPANFDAKAEVAAWHGRETHYVVMSEDLVLPPDAQRFFASRMQATVTEVAASHAGLISAAEVVADVIVEAAN